MFKQKLSIIILSCCISLSTIAQKNNTEINTGVKNVATNKTLTNAKHHVVIEVTSADSLVWKGVMNNVKHLQDSWGNNVQIEVVAHGPGIDLLVTSKTTQQKKIDDFTKSGVVFSACENTLKSKNIAKELVIPQASFVPSGVAELVMKQEQGWSYLKAGF